MKKKIGYGAIGLLALGLALWGGMDVCHKAAPPAKAEGVLVGTLPAVLVAGLVCLGMMPPKNKHADVNPL